MSTLPLFDRAGIFTVDPPKLRPYQSRAIQTLRERVRDGKRRILLVAPTGCHEHGQLVMMYDGSLRAVETVSTGDLLMGPDSSPREVIELRRGRGRMFRIVPVKGEPWIVNEDHVLTLVRTNADKQPHRNGELVDVTVREWLKWPKWQKHIHKLLRVSVEFSTRSLLPIDPYFLGVYLGDGWTTVSQFGIAVGSDIQLEESVTMEAKRFGLHVRRDSSRGESNIVCHISADRGPRSNQLRNHIRNLGLHGVRSGEKFVPGLYLTASRDERLQILAGLIDTDGSLSRSGYDLVSKSRQLAKDVAFLARSVGLAAYVKKCRKGCQTGAVGTYWRVIISGDTSAVPCRVPRKQAPSRVQKKSVLRTGFSVEPAGYDDFYGFTLDGDGRYLLDDFTVTHNSGKMTMIAAIIRTSSVPVLFVAHRMELIDQCCEELARVGITNVGVIRGDDKRENPSASVQVASIQTLARRDKPPAGLVLIDEAHRSASDSYVDLIFDHYKSAIILGFTATPTRYDGKPLGNQYECLEVVCTYETLIKDGFIVEPLCYSGPAVPDLSGIKIIGGDYDETALGDVMRDVSLVGNLLEHWLALSHLYPGPNGGTVEGPRRRTFIFAVGIQHSLDIQERFSKAGIRIAHIDGTTPEKQRRAAIRALGSGDIDAITNVGVLLEGVDVPSAKCVVHARPTQSMVLWRQSGGRIFRPWHPGCPRGCTKHPSVQPLLLDHAGNIPRLGFPHEDLHWELTTRARRIKPPPTRLCPRCFAYIPAHKRVCPYCGTELPPPEDRDLPEESEEELRQLASTPEAMRRMYFDMMVRKAREKGYKPGFASARYKERYGHWPPWGWSEEVKASFASDPVWHANMSAHAKLKEKIEAIKAAKEKAKSWEIDVDHPMDDEDIAF